MKETQESISQWAETTFGPCSALSAATRANKEMSELLHKFAYGSDLATKLDEVADVAICLYRVASMLGGNLSRAIDDKMTINRAREWTMTPGGHGQHK